MSTKPTKPTAENAAPTKAPAKRDAKEMQRRSEAPPQPNEDILAITLRADNSYEYHLDLPRSVVVDLLDPDVDDAFIEVPCVVANARRFLHTSYVKEVDVRGL